MFTQLVMTACPGRAVIQYLVMLNNLGTVPAGVAALYTACGYSSNQKLPHLDIITNASGQVATRVISDHVFVFTGLVMTF
jgi:hypothetical protein